MTKNYDRFIPLNPADLGGGHKSAPIGTGAVTLNVPGNARGIMWQAIAQNIRYTLDGVNPTTGSGFRLTAGNNPLYLALDSRMTLKVCAETAGAYLEFEYCDVNNGTEVG